MVLRPRTKAKIKRRQKRCTRCGSLITRTGTRVRCKRCSQKVF